MSKFESCLSNCPALLPDWVGADHTFLDSLIMANQILAEPCTVDFFLAHLLEVTGRSGTRSHYYYQNVLDALYVVGLIDRMSFSRDRNKLLLSRFPEEYKNVTELRDFCVVNIKSHLKHIMPILNASIRTQPFTRSDLQADLGLTLDNTSRHIRLLLNLGLLTKTGKGHTYTLTPLGEQQLAHVTHTANQKISNANLTLQESDELSRYHTLDDLGALGYLSE